MVVEQVGCTTLTKGLKGGATALLIVIWVGALTHPRLFFAVAKYIPAGNALNKVVLV